MTRLTIHTDGSCYHKDGRMGLGIAWFEDDELNPCHTKGINKHQKVGTNNEAEYLAVINALLDLKREGHDAEEVLIVSDSELVINQINNIYVVRDPKLQQLHHEVNKLLSDFQKDWISFAWCPRTHPRQKVVDKISKQVNPYFIHKKKFGY